MGLLSLPAAARVGWLSHGWMEWWSAMQWPTIAVVRAATVWDFDGLTWSMCRMDSDRGSMTVALYCDRHGAAVVPLHSLAEALAGRSGTCRWARIGTL